MSPYATRSWPSFAFASLDHCDSEPEAVSSVGPASSPVVFPTEADSSPHIAFKDLADLPTDDCDDSPYTPSSGISRERRTNEEKAFEILRHMRTNYSRFSLRTFLETVFKSRSGGIKNYVGVFLASGGAIAFMQLLWDLEMAGTPNAEICDWVVDRAAEVCSKECSHLTDRAARGPHRADAEALRVSAQAVTVSMVQSFTITNLLARYERTMPRLQTFLKAIIGEKHGAQTTKSRNPDHVSQAFCSHMDAVL